MPALLFHPVASVVDGDSAPLNLFLFPNQRVSLKNVYHVSVGCLESLTFQTILQEQCCGLELTRVRSSSHKGEMCQQDHNNLYVQCGF